MGQRAGRGRKLLFTGLVALVPALGAEVWLRATRPRSDLWELTGRTPGADPRASWADLDAFCAYRARPGVYAGLGADGAGRKTVNADGFISTPPLSRERRPGTLRIAFLGESSCAGTGSVPVLADEETWPWQVGALLERRLGRPVEVLNAAGSGYTSFESLGRLAARVRFWRPDVVVIYHGWNELVFAHPDVDPARWRTHADGAWSLTRRMTLLPPRALDHLLWPSQLLVKLRIKLEARLHGQLPEDLRRVPDCDLAGLQVARQNLRLLQELARSLGMEAFVCVQPTLVVPDLPESQRARCVYLPFPHDAHVRALRAYRESQAEEVPLERLIDLTALDGRAGLFLDHIHPSPEGAAEIAARVARALLERSLHVQELAKVGAPAGPS